MSDKKIILGIDPGTQLTGYGVIKTHKKKMELITLGVIHLSKFEDAYERLKKIFDRTLHLIDNYQPTEMAIEAPFYGKNVQSMLKLGRAQGVAISAGLYRNLSIFEYMPRKIKMAITGNGNASKEQVAAFLKNILKIESLPPQLDATDGLAAAVCHFYQNSLSNMPKSSSWKNFIHQNPDRIK